MITEFLVLFKMEVIKKVNVIIISFLFQCLEFSMRKMMEIWVWENGLWDFQK